MKPYSSKAEVKRGPWTPDEDELLSNYVRKEGEGRWRTLPKKAGLLRCGKSCRLRWMNYLRPSIKRGRIAPDEEDLILRLHRLLGNRWALIAGRIPGRTDNEIKNYWNTHLSKKLISQGIDPRTHKPLNPNPSSSSSAAAAAAASGSQPSAPKSNPNPITSTVSLQEKGYGGVEDIINNTNENLEGTMQLDQDHNWLNSKGLMMDLKKINEEDDIEYCTDDDEGIFSSFLNSLINEEMVLDQQQQTNVITPIEALATSVQPDGYDSIWEAARPSSTAAVNDDERKQLHAGQDLKTMESSHFNRYPSHSFLSRNRSKAMEFFISRRKVELIEDK